MSQISIFAQPGLAFMGAEQAARENRLATAQQQAAQAAAEAQQQLRQQAFTSLQGTPDAQANPQAMAAQLAAAGDTEGANLFLRMGAAQETQRTREEARARQRQQDESAIFTNAAQSGSDNLDPIRNRLRRVGSPLADAPDDQLQASLQAYSATTPPPNAQRFNAINPATGRNEIAFVNPRTQEVMFSGIQAPRSPIDNLAAAVAGGRGEQNISDRIVPPEVVARFGQDPNGVYVYETDSRGQVRLQRVDNPEARVVSLTGSPVGSGESVSVYTFGANLSDVFNLVESRSASEFGTPGGLQALAQGVGQQILGLTGVSMSGLMGQARGEAIEMGISERVAEDVFNPALTEIQQTMRLLAFSAASAIGGVEGRSLTDRKLQEFIEAVGDPRSPLNSKNAIIARLRQLDRMVINDINAVRRDRGIDPIPPGLSWLDGTLQQWDRTGVTPDLRPNGGRSGASESRSATPSLSEMSDEEIERRLRELEGQQ